MKQGRGERNRWEPKGAKRGGRGAGGESLCSVTTTSLKLSSEERNVLSVSLEKLGS